jgi:multisubunit Na+/H+ antiporter MnhG subunit
MDIFDWLQLSVPAAIVLGIVFGIVRNKDAKLTGRAASSTRLGFNIIVISVLIFIIVLKMNDDISHEFVLDLVLWLVTPCVSIGTFLIAYGKSLELIEADENEPH